MEVLEEVVEGVRRRDEKPIIMGEGHFGGEWGVGGEEAEFDFDVAFGENEFVDVLVFGADVGGEHGNINIM